MELLVIVVVAAGVALGFWLGKLYGSKISVDQIKKIWNDAGGPGAGPLR